MKTESQNKEILKWLQSGKTITQLQALDRFGCLRLSGRIYDLHKAGHNIIMTLISVGKEGKRVGQYKFIKPKN